MILQALTEYYHRKQESLAPIGFEEKEIPFVIEIDQQGRFIQLQDTRSTDGQNKLKAQTFIVPQGPQRSGAKSYATAFVLWDHFGYVLKQPKLSKPDAVPTAKDILMAERQHEAFKQRVQQISDSGINDEGVEAVLKFLLSESEKVKVTQCPEWNEVLKIKGCNLTFRLADQQFLVCQSQRVQQWVSDNLESDARCGVCLISGETRPIARLHAVVRGVWGAQVAGASLVSFNFDAFESWQKRQGENSPVSEQAVFEYTTALNSLLKTNSPGRFQMGDTSVVCWAQTESPLEAALPLIFSDAPKDDPDRGVKAVTALFKSILDGVYIHPDGSRLFYVLGLSPNASRIAVRFWHSGTIADFSERLATWFRDLEIVGATDRSLPSLKALLRSTALLGKDENMPPHLVGETVRAVILGLPLPASALQAAIKRIKAEQGNVNPYRAALIKAALNRKYRYLKHQKKELSVAHDPSDLRIGYRLGSLFAVLEKLQKDANPGINSTIRDRYYSTASCTPRAVFGTLMRLHTHHLKKLENPSWQTTAQRRISQIISDIHEFPANLDLENQGLFAIGYYQQREAFFTKKETSTEGADA